MSNSPYLSSEIKSYMNKFHIETTINNSINNVLKLQPQDPYAYLINEFQKYASCEIQVQQIKAIQTLLGQLTTIPFIKLFGVVNYMNRNIKITIQQPLGIISEQNAMLDQDKKKITKGINFINQILNKKICGLKCTQQKQIDTILQKCFIDNNCQGLYQINCVSYLPSLISAKVLYTNLWNIFAQKITNNKQQHSIKVMVNCLQGGKAIGSKCKVFKYLLISHNTKNPYLLQNVLQFIRKNIVSGKGGQNALKLTSDGTFICPADGIMDNLKIIQDAINGCNAKDSLFVGLSWAADSLYSIDSKKYQLENPKTPFDSDQMIDYLIKLITDKPIIKYLQDPLSSTDKTSWKKLINKIQSNENISDVKIGSRKGKLLLLNNNNSKCNIKQQLNSLSILQTIQSSPNQSQQTIEINNNNKFNLDMLQLRAFELKTLTQLIQIYQVIQQTNTTLIIQDNNLETYDTTIVDLCYGFNCYLNLGSIQKYDRICKLNRMMEIIQDSMNCSKI